MVRRVLLGASLASLLIVGTSALLGDTRPAALQPSAFEITGLQAQRDLLLEQYGRDHPKVRLVEKQLESLKRMASDPSAEDVGRYQLAANGMTVVLLDTKTGQSWFLKTAQAGAGDPIWTPLKRVSPLPVGP